MQDVDLEEEQPALDEKTEEHLSRHCTGPRRAPAGRDDRRRWAAGRPTWRNGPGQRQQEGGPWTWKKLCDELCGKGGDYAFLSYGGIGPIFFDLRRGLGSGAKESIASSMILAFGVLLVATRNLWIAFSATFTIACITMVVIGSLVLDGWEPVGFLQSTSSD